LILTALFLLVAIWILELVISIPLFTYILLKDDKPPN
jgi:hypothetical protein